MSRYLTFLSALIFAFHLNAFSQDDKIVMNNDTMSCRIHENNLDWISCISFGELVKFSENRIDKEKQTLLVPLTINYIKFSENPGSSYSTLDLMRKLDFSTNSPNFKWVKDFSNNEIYYNGIDTANNRLYWFGLDFSQVNIRLGKAPRSEYDHWFFLDCNDFFLNDDKFLDFREKFSFISDTGIVTNRNDNLNLRHIYNRQAKSLILDSIRSIISSFNVNYNGVGLIIFITDINKETESETFYVTFFDIESKTILLCLKETAKARGVSMVWHWTKAIKEYLDVLTKKFDWKKKYIIAKKPKRKK